jgi:RNA polymerase sigma-70 factor (ECF subfamily)
VIRPPIPPADLEFEALLSHARQFLLALANAELPAALRAKGGASDLVQETFTTALRSREQFNGTTVAELRAWLRAILRSELAMFRRRFTAVAAREVAREVSLGDVEEVPQATHVERLIRDEQTRILSARFATLPGDFQQVVLLRLEEGMPFATIGDRLGRTEEATRKLFGRALDRLRGAEPTRID